MDEITINVTEVTDQVTINLSTNLPTTPVLARQESWLQNDITNNLNGEWQEILSLTLPRGIYLVATRVQLREIIDYSLAYSVKIMTGSETIVAGRGQINSSNIYTGIALHGFVNLAAQQQVSVQVKISGNGYQNAVVCSEINDLPGVKKVTGLHAIKIG